MSDNFPLVAIIDDDVAARRALARLLAAHRYRVLQFASAESYLKGIDGKEVVCAVIDINLGDGMSGLELGREIKASTRPVPIIFMSGNVESPVKVLAWEVGCIDFFEKPCQSSELLAAIHGARYPN
jgi:FixJ family two-component response regulator